MLTRRGFLAGATPALAVATPPIGAPPLRHDAGLHARAQRKGLFFGCVLAPDTFRTDPALLAHVQAECGIVTADCGWARTEPRPDSFALEGPEAVLGFAARHGMRGRGRDLAGCRAFPAWMDAATERTIAARVGHLARRFRRQAAQWDVVSEAIDPDAPGGVRQTRLTRLLGPAALDIAFHACAAADPGALLVLNESGLEYGDAAGERRRGAVLDLVRGMRGRGVPVQAIGIEGHLSGGRSDLDQAALSALCVAAGGLGLKVVVTEFDVDDRYLPGDPALRDAAVAAQARAFLDPVLAAPATLGVLTSGLSDRRVWLNESLPRADGQPQRALPLDREFRRKRLWSAIAAAFDTAPAR
jgi:endo-1,4-beta-xylanase